MIALVGTPQLFDQIDLGPVVPLVGLEKFVYVVGEYRVSQFLANYFWQLIVSCHHLGGRDGITGRLGSEFRVVRGIVSIAHGGTYGTPCSR